MNQKATQLNEGGFVAWSVEEKPALGLLDFDIAAGKHTEAITDGFGEDYASSFVYFESHAI